MKSFLSVSNEKVDGGEAVQKKRKEADLDGEVENEMKKITYYFYCIHSDCTIEGCSMSASNKLPFSFP